MMPHERSLVEKYKDKPFAIIGINSDKDKAKYKEGVEKHQVTWRSFWNGPQGTAGPISKEWLVRGWPTVYVIDHEGVIRHKSHGGPAMDEAIEKAVAAATAALRK
jgi:hypothetical protein